jgi:hypothetical protein
MLIFTVYELTDEKLIQHALDLHMEVGFYRRFTGAKTRAQVEAFQAYGDELEWEVGSEWYMNV